MPGTWELRFERMKLLGWIAAPSPICALVALLTTDYLQIFMSILAALLVLPAFVYLYVIVIWHWKDRYRGSHSDLWSALILLETSGWMKLVYLFRHIIPDIRKTGRYA